MQNKFYLLQVEVHNKVINSIYYLTWKKDNESLKYIEVNVNAGLALNSDTMATNSNLKNMH